MADGPLDKLKKAIQKMKDIVNDVKSLQDQIDKLSEIIEASGLHAAELAKIDLPLPSEPLLDDLKEELRKLPEFGSNLKRQLDTYGQKLNFFEEFVKEKISGKREISFSDIQELCQTLTTAYKTSNVSFKSLNNFIGCLSDSQLLARKLEKNQEEKLKQQSEEKDMAVRSFAYFGIAPSLARLAVLGGGVAALGFFTGSSQVASAARIFGGAGKRVTLSVERMLSMAADIEEKSSKLHLIAKELESNVDKATRVNGEASLGLQSVLEFFSKDELIAQQQEEIAQQQEEIDQLQDKIAQQQETIAAQDEMIARLRERLR
ncbi:hypothetical protein BOX15_Mlig004059g1 [Macrostomum lignano]|uniref:Uncharacterized protein n=1 Tax=Macrostomum lignano TaxID=282301 RepID=A0A267H6E8_9PLAT|nr:hypothetical protein BOX15_Mlig004059g1 [Macrostomum lignano]